MINNPKISLVIPVYNGSNYLSQAIDSALAQTYQNKEIIVVNDGSTDNGLTEKIALSYGDKIRYFSQKNGGVASALNKAIAEMTGEYFSWLSHDDLYFPNKLSSQVDILKKYDYSVIIYSDFAIFYDDENYYQEIKLPDISPQQFRYFLALRSLVHGCTLLIPKSVLLEFSGFNETLRHTQDYDLWFRMAKKYPFIHDAVCLVKGRQHAQQDSIKMHHAALLEYNQLYTSMINDLSKEELLLSESSVSLAYAKLAMSFKQRNILVAKQLTERLMFTYFSESSVYQKPQVFWVLFKGYLVSPIVIKLYKALSNIKRFLNLR